MKKKIISKDHGDIILHFRLSFIIVVVVIIILIPCCLTKCYRSLYETLQTYCVMSIILSYRVCSSPSYKWYKIVGHSNIFFLHLHPYWNIVFVLENVQQANLSNIWNFNSMCYEMHIVSLVVCTIAPKILQSTTYFNSYLF